MSIIETKNLTKYYGKSRGIGWRILSTIHLGRETPYKILKSCRVSL